MHIQCVAVFLMTLFELNFGLHSVHFLITLFVLICKRMKNIKEQNLTEDVVQMVHFLKLIKFTVLFYFASSDQSEMID